MRDCNDCAYGDIISIFEEPCKSCLSLMAEFKGRFPKWKKVRMSECPFAKGWINQEGWLVTESGKLVCMDWDDYCTKCRVDDSKDFVFDFVPNMRKP